MNHITPQERFWSGRFGDDYTARNMTEKIDAAALAFITRALRRTHNIKTAIEFGANAGANLRALSAIVPGIGLSAVEINARACEHLRAWGGCTVWHGSIFERDPGDADLAFTRGVLIHLAPERLPDAYDRLYDAARRYVLVAEYYNPTPVEVEYRGARDRLFKRDFAGELMERHPDLDLIDYGFVYHRDPNFPQDDITWFLMEKRRP